MQRKTIILLLCLLAVACDSGGGGGGPNAPFVAWAKFRRGNTNNGVGSTSLQNNEGAANLLFALPPGVDPTVSSPAVGANERVYLGTSDGLISIDSDGELLWHLRECTDSDGPPRRLGSIVASPTIGANAEDIIVGTEGTDGTNGAIFRLKDELGGTEDDDVSCEWFFPRDGTSFSTRSSPFVIIDPIDLAILSVYAGTKAFTAEGAGPFGRFIALDANGTRRWSFPRVGLFPTEITSSGAISTGGIVINGPDGFIYQTDQTGRELWRFDSGLPDTTDGDFLSSPTSTEGIFTLGRNRLLYSLNVDGTERWRYQTRDDVVGSVATTALNIPREGGTIVAETIAFVVDRSGTAYGLLNRTGRPFRYCSLDDRTCSPSSCPAEAECIEDVNLCSVTPKECESNADCPEGQFCDDNLCSVTPMVCESNADCPEDQFCDDNLCAVTPMVCEGNADCPEGEFCDDIKVCSVSTNIVCSDGTPCPEGEDCEDADLCSNNPTEKCTPDTCLDDDDAGLCTREAVMPLYAIRPVEVVTSPAVSTDDFVLVGTTDGKLCARQMDGSTPNGECETSRDFCSPDSCPLGSGRCCGEDDSDCTFGHCQIDTEQACTPNTCDTRVCRVPTETTCTPCENNDTCPESQVCRGGFCSADTVCQDENDCPSGQICQLERCCSAWRSGCIQVGETTISSAVIGREDTIYVTTEAGLVEVE